MLWKSTWQTLQDYRLRFRVPIWSNCLVQEQVRLVIQSKLLEQKTVLNSNKMLSLRQLWPLSNKAIKSDNSQMIRIPLSIWRATFSLNSRLSANKKYKCKPNKQLPNCFTLSVRLCLKSRHLRPPLLSHSPRMRANGLQVSKVQLPKLKRVRKITLAREISRSKSTQ